MKRVLITRKLIKSSEEYAASIFNVKLNKEDKVLTKDELMRVSACKTTQVIKKGDTIFEEGDTLISEGVQRLRSGQEITTELAGGPQGE